MGTVKGGLKLKCLLQWYYEQPIEASQRVRLLDVDNHYRLILKNYGELSTDDTRFDNYLVTGSFYDSGTEITYCFVKCPPV